MNSDLLDCKRQALLLAKSENLPVKDNGRRKGYMELMKELWDQMVHEDLGLTKQNLRDQAARLEKSLGSVTSIIINGIKANRGGDNVEGVLNNRHQIAINADQEEPDLHTTLSQYQQCDNGDLFSQPGLHTTLTQDQEMCRLLEPANRIMEIISTHPGDYSQRDIDTRTKETPSPKELEEINQAVKLLMERYEVTPTQSPFGFLWLANCVLYSVVCAFLLMKGWKKQVPIKAERSQDTKEKLKRIYDQEAGKIRKQLSIAKAEIERLKENRKITKKGRKNRCQLQKECKTISVAGLVSYMEKKKSELRKLKRGFDRKKKRGLACN